MANGQAEYAPLVVLACLLTLSQAQDSAPVVRVLRASCEDISVQASPEVVGEAAEWHQPVHEWHGSRLHCRPEFAVGH